MWQVGRALKQGLRRLQAPLASERRVGTQPQEKGCIRKLLSASCK